MRSWPYVASLGLGLIPVALFAGMVAMIAVNARPALDAPGLGELFSDRFASQYTTGEQLYGLFPAMAGTVLVAVVAIGVALPVSLAVAVYSSEFAPGFMSRTIQTVLGALSGIPSIVYALLAVVLVEQFMIPKFAADSTFGTFDPATVGATTANWPPSDVPWNAGALPWDPTGLNNSLLLAGILIGLLVIPFMAPLIYDALRGVPATARESSLALGANRWYTLRRVSVPFALPGIIAAAALGILKALGDTMIVIFVVGWEANALPDPGLDILERPAPLSAVGAGLLGGFQSGSACREPACSVGYASALLLLVAAVVVVLATAVLQSRLRRRYAQ